MKHAFAATAVVLAHAVLLSACVSPDPRRVQADHRNSVNNVILGQMADPEAAASAGGAIVEGLDGPTATQAMRAYRSDTGSRGFGDVQVNSSSVTAGGAN